MSPLAAPGSATATAEEVARARKKAQARYDFRWSFVIYVLVNAFLVGVWYFGSIGFFWPIFPIFGWGIGIAAEYYTAYVRTDETWVDRETQKILSEQQSKES